MQETTDPACGHCGSVRTVSNGSSHGHHQWSCRACGRSFRATTGAPPAQLKTPVDEIARALLVVLRRGSMRAPDVGYAMMHEYYEISIAGLLAMSKGEFLERCRRYLDDALLNERRRDTEREAQDYTRKYLGFDPGDFPFHFGICTRSGGVAGGLQNVAERSLDPHTVRGCRVDQAFVGARPTSGRAAAQGQLRVGP